MVSKVNKLLNDALKLPEKDRAELAGRLLETLDPVADEDWAQAWESEVLKRIDELESGAVTPIAWSKARDMILRDRDESSAD